MSQIGEYKNTNLRYTNAAPKCQKDPTCGIFLKRGLFMDILCVSHGCTRSSLFSVWDSLLSVFLSGQFALGEFCKSCQFCSGFSSWKTFRLGRCFAYFPWLQRWKDFLFTSKTWAGRWREGVDIYDRQKGGLSSRKKVERQKSSR